MDMNDLPGNFHVCINLHIFRINRTKSVYYYYEPFQKNGSRT